MFLRSLFLRSLIVAALAMLQIALSPLVAFGAPNPVRAVTDSSSYQSLMHSIAEMAAIDNRQILIDGISESQLDDDKVVIEIHFIAVARLGRGPDARPARSHELMVSRSAVVDPVIRPFGGVRAIVQNQNTEWVLVSFEYLTSLK